MAFSSFRLSRVPLLHGDISSGLHPLLPPFIPFLRTPQNSTFRTLRTFNQSSHMETSPPSTPSLVPLDHQPRWRPLCLYHTQGRCTKIDDPMHLEKFNHDYCRGFPVKAEADLKYKRPQEFDYFLVLDLEGKVEILEFPVLMIDSRTLCVVDLFHRFVRPSATSEQRIDTYIQNKYGKLGVDRVWHDTALPFNEVLHQFESWLIQHNLWSKKHFSYLTKAAFVTCGNWDVKTQVPRQCTLSNVKLPPYFMEWINLKDVYLNFYKPEKEAKGMRTMMEQLKIPMLGSHHLGIDDTNNIARVLLRMLADGAIIPITAWRNTDSFKTVNFLYKNRVV